MSQKTWQSALSHAITSVDELLQQLQLTRTELPFELAEEQAFRLKVPQSFVSRMQVGNPYDPLLLQVLPLGQELMPQPGFTKDPLHEAATNPVPGLLHKYKSRALLTITGSCAIHCRYCFRRHFPYEENIPGNKGWGKAIEYIAAHDTINEVILSGGDPLVANDKQLASLIKQLDAIPHLKLLRIHSRLPIVLPERINDAMLDWLRGSRLKSIVVIHCNHAQEINASVIDAIQKLRTADVTVLNQTVLLKGINDDPKTLSTLSEMLFEHDVLPYYLHLLDPVEGAAHFDVPEEKAQQLYGQIMQSLPGYLVPKLVQEKSGAKCKLPVSPSFSG